MFGTLHSLASRFAAGVCLTLFAAATAHAQNHTMGQHPAVLLTARTATINPHQFIVQLPVSTPRHKGHALGEHPG